MKCRFCNNKLTCDFIDLINSPPSNSYLTVEQLNEPETYFPLKLYLCEKCFLVQIDEYKKSNEIFNDNYAYYSSYSTSWLAHCKRYVDTIIDRFELDRGSQVIEIASNDGYLLQYFKEKNIPAIGIEPSSNVASVAINKGIETITDFFGEELASRLVEDNIKADLIIGNNVFAHVPDVNDFVKGLKTILKDDGIITLEFPHLMQLIEQNQFDTIYHEHYSYFSLYTASQIFKGHELEIFDVDTIPTHGGSLRVYGRHQDGDSKEISKRVIDLLAKENSKGMCSIDYYTGFIEKVEKVKIDLIEFLISKKKEKVSVAAYGAAAKGNTLLNYCGIKNDYIEFIVDASPHKQGQYLPGSHIPIVNEEMIRKNKPEYILILPWNLKDEITEQLGYIREWKGKFVIPIPKLEIIE
jgi:SAM-dependent methyltransferase